MFLNEWSYMETIHELMPDLREALTAKAITEVWLDGQQSPTPVKASELFHSKEFDFCIEERADEKGDVRVSTLFVPQGQKSPRWLIKADAGDGRYVEEQIGMSGKGWSVCMILTVNWLPSTAWMAA